MLCSVFMIEKVKKQRGTIVKSSERRQYVLELSLMG